MAKLNLRDRLEDGELDLSMSDLEEVPVKEIVAMKKARSLDLSNNRLTKLGKNFATMTHIIKLDLGKNFLTELPENFGDMVQLKHLDLYGNKIDRLPLSFGQLNNLRWLDLKGNPLVPKLAEVAGTCRDASECAKCAKSVVALLRNMAITIEEEKIRREEKKNQQREAEETNKQNVPSQRKENKKKKKAAKTEKLDNKKITKDNSDTNHRNDSCPNENGYNLKKPKEPKKKGLFWGLLVKFLLLVLVSGLVIYFTNEDLFWRITGETQSVYNQSTLYLSDWWKTKGVPWSKQLAGSGLSALEEAKRIAFSVYDSMSHNIPIYVESIKKMM